jgi:hypothetical protein
MANPVRHGTTSISTGRGCDGGQRDGLCPSCSAINHGKNVCVSLGRWQWTYNIYMYVGKTAFRYRNGRSRRCNVFVNLGFLARHTLARPADIWDQTNLEESKRRVALIPGWPKECT